MFEVHIIARETIVPSSPTPHSTPTFALSLLDQIAPRTYVPLLLFYSGQSSKTSVDDVSTKLKTSLSEAISYFYPFAGRLSEDGLTVDCNDEGIDFYESRVDGQLSEFLHEPAAHECNRFLPPDYHFGRSNTDMLLAAQLNVFDCGGVAIGLWVFHRVADGKSLAAFVDRWAAIARGADEMAVPIFDSARHFPAREAASAEINSAFPMHENVVTKRFVFSAGDIARLRAGKNQDQRPPTRVEAVSALIWQSVIRAESKAEGERLFIAMHAVNVRGRMMPPLPDHLFGNLCVDAVASWVSDGRECSGNLQQCLEWQLRDSIKKVDIEYIIQLQGPDGSSKVNEPLEELLQKYSPGCGVEICLFSSWCRFGLYDADFGWGKPTWISLAQTPFKNLIILMETRSGDGIEAWVSMDAEEMAAFEQDEDLLSFISPPKLG
ncbi:hypothetical protein ACLOJK_008269 [Asimina triloba]